MPRILVVDAGGTTRQVKRLFVIDSGGTARLVKRAFVIDAGGTARSIFSGAVLSLNDFTLFEFVAGGGERAQYRLNSNGNVEASVTDFFGDDFTTRDVWVTPGSAASDYEVLATFVSGNTNLSTIEGTFGSWLPLSSSRTWGLSSFAGLAGDYTFTLQIREAATGTIVDSATIHIYTAFF